MPNNLEQIRTAVTAWPGVTASPHRFGGLEFNLDSTEIGHVHHNGMVDIPFNTKIRNQLIAEGKAEPHHLLHDTGWISFYIRSEQDIQAAIDLLKLSYLFYLSRGNKRAAHNVDIEGDVARLGLSDGLQAVFDNLTLRR
jgi:hypothetical protein